MRSSSETALTTHAIFDDLFREMNRVAIGFEPTLQMLKDARNITLSAHGFPPYNLEMVSEDHYRITLAVAGFKDDDLDIQVHQNQLTITGEIKNKTERNYLHQGIANRSFTKQFQLAEHVRVETANLEDGLLVIDLIREVPEALKSRKIPINNSMKVIDGGNIS